jgi:hypothetical protein
VVLLLGQQIHHYLQQERSKDIKFGLYHKPQHMNLKLQVQEPQGQLVPHKHMVEVRLLKQDMH